MVAGILFGEGDLRLSPMTAAKYLALKSAVFRRTGKWIFITRPYGAGRTREQQQYLRNGYERGLPGFNYAAKPDTIQANHQDRGDGGHAFDINNWKSVGEQVIKEEAAKLGLRRDPTEQWHWNDTGIAVAGLNITSIEEDDMGAQEQLALKNIEDKVGGYGKRTENAEKLLIDLVDLLKGYGGRIEDTQGRVIAMPREVAVELTERTILLGPDGQPAQFRAVLEQAARNSGSTAPVVINQAALQTALTSTVLESLREVLGADLPDDIAEKTADVLARRLAGTS